MAEVLVITPVKDSIATTLETATAINASTVALNYTIYNDFSEEANRRTLEENSPFIGYDLVNLEDITQTPSPNYRLILQLAQQQALEKNLPLLIIESDVVIKQDTVEHLMNFYKAHQQAGLVGAVTTDESGNVNFPYLKFRNNKTPIIQTHRSLSFCCTLMSTSFLKKYDFNNLDASKDWFDTHISYKAIELGFKNYLLMDVPVLHRPHGSRPWKSLKYKNPLKYYLNKFLYGKDKI
ncbi:MAG TPA: hypothetical protein VK014_00465 [Cyclobacteriaceae bacterium]|nr:hypothetical protein [Cyclobacteriaceae bacterium]